jgi:hypothetical protein
MARSLDRDEKIHPKVFQKRVELMNAAEKAALDQVMKYMYYNSHPKKDG